MFRKSFTLLASLVLIMFSFTAQGQKNTAKKYPSLLWEITGNGLKKPSYLFGTMHVSSKMAFHLSDSFYLGIKSVETVALELNPDLWQGQMVHLDEMRESYSEFSKAGGNDYLNENSFRLSKYDDELKEALYSEPTVVNSLLYRTYKSSEDFEEDTFLDLYIFQTGKKLGKKATGVEDYYETEKVIMEAYVDMANEKKKKNFDSDGESMRDIQKKIQEAYRRGDLDLMDSLDNMTERSEAFRAKFLYKRNEIQANSIDTILKKSSLFVGVGAAHLPGEKGVIELLRKKGYKLRPIKMADRDAVQKDVIDKVKVPVSFSLKQSDDGFYKVATPGPLFKLTDEYQTFDTKQYSDMSNGSYYLVTRVKTHAAFLGQNENAVVKKIDSLLYENIPGKILKKTIIKRNGYNGYDITNKTRRGDIQRYNIFVTPFEVIIFKMGGKENYAEGKEAEQFFSSIQLKDLGNSSIVYTPKHGGFSVTLPQIPNESLSKLGNSDHIDRWEIEAVDKTTGDAYMVFKKSLYNYDFLESDTFDLRLIEESFRSPDFFDKQLERKLSSYKGYPSLDVKEIMKDSGIVTAKYIIKGPHYYILAVRSNDRKKDFNEYFNSFSFTPFNYTTSYNYQDTFLHFKAATPVKPAIEEDYRALIEKATESMMNGNMYSKYSDYWPKDKYAFFKSDSTGEIITVSVQKYPKYYYVNDSSKFWKNEIENSYDKEDLVLYRIDTLKNNKETIGFHFVLTDTGSSRTIEKAIMLKDDYMFNIATQGDTLNHQSKFISSFFSSFSVEDKKLGRNIFNNVLDTFFNDLFSKDSATHANALQAINNVYYGEKGIPKIVEAIGKLKPTDKDYFDTKTRLIAELGYIKDTTSPQIVSALKKIYDQTADTSMFQNQAVESLAKHETLAATNMFKELLLQDPPVYESSYDYSSLFSYFEDSLLLAKQLFPDLLQLTTLDDYKEPILSLLVTLVDSGYVKADAYENYFSKIYFDAKIELKKQQNKDERKMDQENKTQGDDEPYREYSYDYDDGGYLNDYAVLLIPFYDKNANIPKYFEKLLRSKDESVQMNTATLLLRHNKPVADSILLILASKDKTRGKLYEKLEEIKRLDKFPAQYKNQTDLARSYLVSDKDYNKMDSIVLVTKQSASYENKKGVVYFYKYRVKKEDDWKIGFSGLQPENATELSSDDKFALMTDKKIKNDLTEEEQFQEQFKKLLFNFHKSAKYFFNTGYNYRFNTISEYRD